VQVSAWTWPVSQTVVSVAGEFFLSSSSKSLPEKSSRSHGFVIGHVVPEAQVGGPIALVKDGDVISVDAVKNTIHVLHVEEEEWERRRKAWKAPPLKVHQGTLYKYTKLVADASLGCVTDA